MSEVDLTVGQDDQGVRLDRWIRRVVGDVPQARIERLVRVGRIRIDGRLTRSGERLMAGQRVRICDMAVELPPRSETPVVPEHLARQIRQAVLYRDSDVIVLDKPAGLAVQGGTRMGMRHIDALSSVLAGVGEGKPMLVHRLDRQTSGVLVLACNRRSAANLARSFRSRAVRKLYWAIVEGVPDPAVGEVSEVGELTRYRTIEVNAGRNLSWLALFPHTGRKHQLRRHLSGIGHPIVGDSRYSGYDSEYSDRGGVDRSGLGLGLHARRLWLPAAGDREGVCFEAPVPSRFAELFELPEFGFDTPGADHWHG